MHHTRVTSKLHFTSEETFSIKFPITPLCFYTALLDQGNFAAVVFTLIFTCSLISLKTTF